MVAESVLEVLAAVVMAVAVERAVAAAVVLGVDAAVGVVSVVMAVSVVVVAAGVPVVVLRYPWCQVHWMTYQGRLKSTKQFVKTT